MPEPGNVPMGLAAARKKVCMDCGHKCYRASFGRWMRCTYGVEHIRDEAGGLEVSDDFWLGAASECPAGKWHGLAPVDLEAAAQERIARRVESERRGWKDMLLAAFRRGERISAQQAGDILATFVGAGIILPETAAEIEYELTG